MPLPLTRLSSPVPRRMTQLPIMTGSLADSQMVKNIVIVPDMPATVPMDEALSVPQAGP